MSIYQLKSLGAASNVHISLPVCKYVSLCVHQSIKLCLNRSSTGPGPVDLAKKKNDIDIRKVLMLVHLFPKYFEIIFLRSVCGSV